MGWCICKIRDVFANINIYLIRLLPNVQVNYKNCMQQYGLSSLTPMTTDIGYIIGQHDLVLYL